MDEATSALDTQTEFTIQENIDALRKGKTTIIIAHRLSTIRNADVIYVMEAGKIAAYGSHQDLLSACVAYQELYRGSGCGEVLPAGLKREVN